MSLNDHDLYTAGLPTAFTSSKRITKTRGKKKEKKQQKHIKKQVTVSVLENIAEEFGVMDVLARFKDPFTILMTSEERLSRNDEIDYDFPEDAHESDEVEEDEEARDADKTEKTEDAEYASETENAENPSLGTTQDQVLSTPSKPAQSLHKYYQQRYDYFSRFDEGIQIDDEGWYSVTPESIAKHTANELHAIANTNDDEKEEMVVVDAFCGVGGNSIQFAQVFDRVIAIDLSPTRLEMAKHNAEIYGVADKIEFILGDAFEVLKSLQKNTEISAIFLSPPWGGPEYVSKPVFCPKSDLFDGRGSELFQLATSLTPNCVLFLPRQSNIYAVAQMIQEQKGRALEESDSFVVEQHYLRNRLKAISIYLW